LASRVSKQDSALISTQDTLSTEQNQTKLVHLCSLLLSQDLNLLKIFPQCRVTRWHRKTFK